MNIQHAPWTGEDCRIQIFAEQDLSFAVSVDHMGKRYVRGGFDHPDAAQKRGVEIMLAMHRACTRRRFLAH